MLSFPRLRRLVLVVVIVLAAAIIQTSAAAEPGGVDWIFVLDTSASMHGAGGTVSIFGKVKDAIAQFINNAHEGDTITLYTFDNDTTLRAHIRISGEVDKRDLLATITTLSSKGDRTYTGKAIHDALERAIELKKRFDSANRTISIVLFTDGLEDVRGIANPISIPSNIALIPKDQPYIFFVSVGVQAHEPQLESFVKDPAMGNRGEVIKDPGASSIAEIGEKIRQKVETPKQLTPIQLNITPTELLFGEIEPGATARQTLRITPNSSCGLTVALNSSENQGLAITEPKDAVQIKAGQTYAMEIGVTAAKNLNSGVRSFVLVLRAEPTDNNATTSALNVESTISLLKVPIWRKAINYVLLLFIAFAIALVIISVIKGEPPWIWLPAFTEPTTLQGELQLIQPRPSRVEDEFISLTQLRARKVALSSLIPNGGSRDSDAELEAIKQNGKVNMKLQRLSGAVFINKIEVATSNLYNEDVIELGDSKLLFNWVNHDRPMDSKEV